MQRQGSRGPAGTFSAHLSHLDLEARGQALAEDAVHAMVGRLTDVFLLSAVSLAATGEDRAVTSPGRRLPPPRRLRVPLV